MGQSSCPQGDDDNELTQVTVYLLIIPTLTHTLIATSTTPTLTPTASTPSMSPSIGIITTVAGSSTTGTYSGDGAAATSALLNGPSGVTLDATGKHLYN